MATRTPQLNQPHRTARAFTLLELIAVLLIIALAMAAVAPSLRGFAEGRTSAHFARSFVALADWARNQSISEGREYRLHVDVDEGTYYVTAQQGGAFEPVPGSLGRTFDLPERLTISWEEPDDIARLGYVTFEPTGRVTPATLLIEESTGRLIRVRAATVGDRFAVSTESPLGGVR